MNPSAERLERRIRDAIVTLESLLAPADTRGKGTAIAELLRRAEMPSIVDGYPVGSGAERTSGGVTGNPTLQAVMAREDDVCNKCLGGSIKLKNGSVVTCRVCNGSGRRWADPVGDAVLEIEARLLSISHDARLIERHRKLIAASAQVKGRQSSLQGECSACGDATTGLGEDRLRAGLDNKCYLSMTSWKLRNPDTQSDPGAHYRKFIAWRRDSLAEKAQRAVNSPHHLS